MLYRVFHVSEAEPGDGLLHHGHLKIVRGLRRLARRRWVVTFDDGTTAEFAGVVQLSTPDEAAPDE